LHLKKGDKSRAIQTYTDVADMFSRGGFDAKAVAIYKQILRVEEESLEARTRLGECFQRMGLTSDALREFQDAFKICQKRELKREAFELLRRVASLDPSNVANRLNLAGLFAREGMQEDAQREFASLLEEVRRQTGAPDLVVRVAEQMLHAFPDSREALEALAWAKLSSGAHAEAVKLLKPAIAKFPDDIPLRESLVGAYEGAGDAAAAKRLWREIAEMYKRRGDVEKSRDILQRHAVMEEFSAGDENTTPSILLTDSTGRTLANDDDDILELDDPAPAKPAAPSKPAAPAARAPSLVERGHATPPPNRAGPMPTRQAPPAKAAPAQESAADLIAEARVSLEFGDPEEASRLARRVLEIEPGSKAARDLLAEASQSPGTEDEADAPGLLERNALEESEDLTVEPVAPPSLDTSRVRAEIEALAPGEDFDTLPDIEIVLEDEEDRDEKFASVEPPLSLELDREPAPIARKPPAAKPAPAPIAAKAPPQEDDLDIEIEIEGEGEAESEEDPVSLEFSKPLASEQEASFGDASAKITENLSEADFYLEQGLVDEAARIYESVLERVPHHPKAMLRMGEIAAKRGKKPGKPGARSVAPAEIDESAFGDTMVQEPDGREALSLPEIEESVEALELEPSVVGEDTIPPFEPEPAPSDELVFAQDSGSALELDPEPDDDALHETSEAHEGEGEFDLAAMLDEDEADQTGTIGTLIGVGSVGKGFAEVFSAFKKGIQAQVDEGDADTHYDLAIAYKEMGLNEDAVRELETVLRTGTRAIESLSLLASCKLALGDAGAAAAHIEDALGRAGDSHESAVSLRYDLGEALLAAGRDREALDAFKKVAAADPDFRDVVERISRFG